MRNLQWSLRYSPALLFTGLMALVFTLFLQPMDPLLFIERTVSASSGKGLTVSPAQPATTAFWLSLTIFTVGSVGMLLRLLQRRVNKKTSQSHFGDNASHDGGEDDWIFI